MVEWTRYLIFIWPAEWCGVGVMDDWKKRLIETIDEMYLMYDKTFQW